MKDLSRIGFFFQAEDGIRDKLVTGVQTCALPILDAVLLMGEVRAAHASCRENQIGLAALGGNPHQIRARGLSEVEGPQRSEERRVGKECRSRWSPYH